MEIKGRTVNVYLIGQLFDSDLLQAFFLEKFCQPLAELAFVFRILRSVFFVIFPS